jgi:hypothetical protein
MVNPSIILAHALLKKARKNTVHLEVHFDELPDCVTHNVHGGWAIDEIEKSGIDLSVLPTWLDEQLCEAVAESIISENIQGLIDEAQEWAHEKAHWYC